MIDGHVVYGPFWPVREAPEPVAEILDLEGTIDIDELVARQIVALEAELSADPAMAAELVEVNRVIDRGDALAQLISVAADIMLREGDR